MKLLKPAEFQMAYAKICLLGFAGSGKTFTSANLTIGLWELLNKKLGEKRPVAFLDTETGSDFVIPKFKRANIPLVTAKTRAFKDLLSVTEEAERDCSILMIDSISHFWLELLRAYQRKLNRKRLQFQDWNVIKPEWGRFSDLYVNSKLHIISSGRAGFTYDYFEDEDGHKQLEKTGTKMKAETEFSYEPSLIIEMELVPDEHQRKTIHRAYIIKDRSDLLDGKWFDNPTFKEFKPHIDFLNIGGEHFGVDADSSSENLFTETGDTDWSVEKRERKAALEEIQNELVKRFPTRSGTDNVAKIRLLEHVFETSSWSRIENMKAAELLNGLTDIRQIIATPEQLELIINPQSQQNLPHNSEKKTATEKLAAGNENANSPEGTEDLEHAQLVEGISIIGNDRWECISAELELPRLLSEFTPEQTEEALKRVNQEATPKA
jgi:hypothetical protein